jgi:hypothetical protein
MNFSMVRHTFDIHGVSGCKMSIGFDLFGWA